MKRVGSVVVVGGGLTGTLACLQLLEADPTLSITLVERRPGQLHRGVAYSAELSHQVLNVPAARMGLFPGHEDAFWKWMEQEGGGDLPPGAFLPRNRYGDHVEAQFNAAMERWPGRVRIRLADAVGVEDDGAEFRVVLDDGDALHATHLLLALGHAPPAHVPHLSEAASAHPNYVPWPWRPGALARIAPQDTVLFVGAGLTMIDIALSLVDQGHTGPIRVISRRGALPAPHAATTPYSFTEPLPAVAEVGMIGLLRWLRKEVRTAEAEGICWQSVVDALRHKVQDIWQAAPVAERRSFIRHLRPFWEVHRHRMPVPVGERLHALREAGRLSMFAGRIQGVEQLDGRFAVHYQLRGTAERATLHGDHLVNCTGPQSDGRRVEQPLLVDLLRKGMATLDPLRMGLRTTALGTLIDAEGLANERIHLLGPMCKPALWECTAVPEIREQVHAVVSRLCR